MGIDAGDAFRPTIDLLYPVNFVRRECLKGSQIMDKIAIRGTSVKNTRKDFTVIDGIVSGEAFRKKSRSKCRDLELAAHVYK